MIRQRQTTGVPQIRDDRDGAALVEMAVTFPLFMMIILAIVEFGRAMMVANLLTNAAREGARMAITSGVTNSDVQTAVIDQVTRTVGTTITTADVDIYISTYPSGAAVKSAPLSGAQKRDLIEVEVFADYDDVSTFPVRFLSGVRLRGQAAMRHE